MNGMDQWVDFSYGVNFSEFSYSMSLNLTNLPPAGKLGMLVNKCSYWATGIGEFPFISCIGNDGKCYAYFSYGDDFTVDVTLASTAALVVGRWYKITVTYKANNTAALYVDGILQQSAPVQTLSPGFIGWSVGRATIEASGGVGASYLDGEIDELSLWDVALTETAIRNWMCKRITTAHPFYSRLKLYYNFNVVPGTPRLPELSGNHFDAFVITNGTTPAPFVTSGAGIGNESAYSYAANPSATLTHPQGEGVVASAASGSPAGLQLYRVDAQPNNVSGLSGLGGNNRYFGISAAEGNAPQFTITYNYTGNPFVSAANEATLCLYRRANNGTAIWTDCNAVLNTVANTLTVTGESGEYILGSSGVALPVTLLSFTGRTGTAQAFLQWTTENETNASHFVIERSKDAMNYTEAGNVLAANAAGRQAYTFTDAKSITGVNYYRLKQLDRNNRFVYSEVLRLFTKGSRQDVALYPNPVLQTLFVDGTANSGTVSYSIHSVTGALLKRGTQSAAGPLAIDVNELPRGTYLLHLQNGKSEQSSFFWKQ